MFPILLVTLVHLPTPPIFRVGVRVRVRVGVRVRVVALDAQNVPIQGDTVSAHGPGRSSYWQLVDVPLCREPRRRERDASWFGTNPPIGPCG